MNGDGTALILIFRVAALKTYFWIIRPSRITKLNRNYSCRVKNFPETLVMLPDRFWNSLKWGRKRNIIVGWKSIWLPCRTHQTLWHVNKDLNFSHKNCPLFLMDFIGTDICFCVDCNGLLIAHSRSSIQTSDEWFVLVFQSKDEELSVKKCGVCVARCIYN